MVAPALIVTAPPTPVDPNPTAIVIFPPEMSLSPVTTDIAPDEEPVAVPDETTTFPLTPAAPASAVDKVREPEDVLIPSPVVICNCPPVAVPLSAAVICTDPPSLDKLSPIWTKVFPPLPPDEDEQRKYRHGEQHAPGEYLFAVQRLQP